MESKKIFEAIFIKSSKNAKQARITKDSGLFVVVYGGTMGGNFVANSYDDVKIYKTLKMAIKHSTNKINK